MHSPKAANHGVCVRHVIITTWYIMICEDYLGKSAKFNNLEDIFVSIICILIRVFKVVLKIKNIITKYYAFSVLS